MRNGLSDPFGGPTAERPWDDGSDSVENAQKPRLGDAFEFMQKCGIAPYYCFHDRDVAPELNDLAGLERRPRRGRR
jgi:xylose isomerase